MSSAVSGTPRCSSAVMAAKMDTPSTASDRQPHPVSPLRMAPRPPGDEDGAKAILQSVAARLRATRRARGMTLEELSATSGVSRTGLSQIERQRCNPSLSSLWKIAAGLGLRFLDLIDSPADVNTVVVRASPLPCHSPPTSRLLAPLAATPWGRAHDFTLPPETLEALAALPPGTRQLVVVLKGALRVHLGRSHHDLGEGDSLVAFADIEHAYENTGSEMARFHLFVLSPR